MMQQTSIESYRKLKDERVLNQRLWEALEFIIKNGRVVARSIPNAGWKRCATLAAMGLIKPDGNAYDSDTKRTVKVWVPTGKDASQVVVIKSPKKIKKRKGFKFPEADADSMSANELTHEMLDELEKKLGVLADQNDKLAAHNIQMMQDIAQLQLALVEKNTIIDNLTKQKPSDIIKL